MATTTLTLITLHFKPSLQPTPDSPPASLQTTCSALLSAPGLTSLHYGPLAELPPSWLLVARWESVPAHNDFFASDASDAFTRALREVGEDISVETAEVEGDVAAVLSAPCLEFFTAYDVEDAFLKERLPAFAKGLLGESMEGFHGLCYGELEVDARGDAAVMLLGWDSKEAHLAQRGDGKPIDRHIHLVREGRDSVRICHVDLKRLA